MSLRFATLDRPSIRRLKPGGKITEHGITAERLADGDLRYSVNVMVDGKRIHRVVGKTSDYPDAVRGLRREGPHGGPH